VSQEPWESARLFPRSVQSLAQLALRETRADGFAIYELDRGGGPVLKSSGGFQIPGNEAEGPGVVAFPLRIGDGVSGRLSFFFCNASIGASTRLLLEKIAQTVESVWRFSRAPERYTEIAQRIGELEVELADAKIADRASGLLQNAAASSGPIDAIARHVESVLRPSEIESMLAQFEHDLVEQLAERQLTSQAKALLQSRYGMSEEQAHAHLRVLSRTTRRRLKDVAQALIENPVLDASQRILDVPGKQELHAKGC
jgi:ANTAR domain